MNVDKHQASRITQQTKHAAVLWHSVQFHDMSYLISMLLVHEHKTETSWINTRTTCVAILPLSFMIYVSHHVDKCYWMIDLASHKSVPLGVFPCFLKVDWVDRLCLFRFSHILSPFFAGSYPIPIYPLFTPSWGTRRPRGNDRWLRTPVVDAGQVWHEEVTWSDGS